MHQVLDMDGKSLHGEIDSGTVELLFAADFPLRQVKIGNTIWRTRDSARDGGPKLDPRLASRRATITMEIRGQLGEPLRLGLTDAQERSVESRTEMLLQAASGQPLDAIKLRKAVGQLGNTPFRISKIVIDPAFEQQGLFVSPSQIKQARRLAIAALRAARREHQRADGLSSGPVLNEMLPLAAPVTCNDRPRITVLCRTQAQVDAVLRLADVDEVIVDFLEVHGLKDACEAVRQAGRRLTVAAPRIFKPGEERLWRYYLLPAEPRRLAGPLGRSASRPAKPWRGRIVAPGSRDEGQKPPRLLTSSVKSRKHLCEHRR